MKFSCEKALLQSMIAIASRAVAPKSTIPALEGVLLEAEQELNLTGYNLKTGIRGTISADISEPGSIVLSARLFGDIIRRLPDDVVTLSTNDLMVNITCGMSEFNILGIDPSQFPELPAVEYQNSMILPQRILHSMITETIFAVSTNDSRPIHTGELFERDGVDVYKRQTCSLISAGTSSRSNRPVRKVSIFSFRSGSASMTGVSAGASAGSGSAAEAGVGSSTGSGSATASAGASGSATGSSTTGAGSSGTS